MQYWPLSPESSITLYKTVCEDSFEAQKEQDSFCNYIHNKLQSTDNDYTSGSPVSFVLLIHLNTLFTPLCGSIVCTCLSVARQRSVRGQCSEGGRGDFQTFPRHHFKFVLKCCNITSWEQVNNDPNYNTMPRYRLQTYRIALIINTQEGLLKKAKFTG